MKKKKKGDLYFLIILSVLIIYGLAILASSSVVLSYENFGSSYGYIERQILRSILPGIVIFFIVSRINISLIKKSSVFLLMFSIFLLFLLFIPDLSMETKGASRWLQIGPINFQPSELLKLSFILYLAAWLETRRKNISSFHEGLVPFLVICSILVLFLLAQPDVGTLGVILLIGISIYFAAGGRIYHLFLTSISGLIFLTILIYAEPYRFRRWAAFINPDLDPLGAGYQVKQALIAIGSGGFFGLGYGMSKQKYNYLPEPMGDSIFAIGAEELGFVGSVFLLFLFLLLIWRGFKIAKNTKSIFGKLTVVGIILWISIQAFVNIGAISGIMPLTGITLPFISYGGSSMLVLIVACAIVYNISRDSNISKG